jgi:hypothetical protein
MNHKQAAQDHKAYEARVLELVRDVKDGCFTPEEAALSLAGFHAKQQESAGRFVGDQLSYHQLRIDQLLPGHQGLVPGRHI